MGDWSWEVGVGVRETQTITNNSTHAERAPLGSKKRSARFDGVWAGSGASHLKTLPKIQPSDTHRDREENRGQTSKLDLRRDTANSFRKPKSPTKTST